MGNLQSVKGTLDLDRVDLLIYHLNIYYQYLKKYNDESSWSRGTIYNLISQDHENGEFLKKYINKFDNIYDYCQQIYFIYDSKLVDDLITNGGKEILYATNTQIPDDKKEKYTSVEEYMNLAERFWRAKELYFISKDNEEWLNDITSGGQALTKDQLKNIFCDYGSCSESDLDDILNIYLSKGFLTEATKDVYVK